MRKITVVAVLATLTASAVHAGQTADGFPKKIPNAGMQCSEKWSGKSEAMYLACISQINDGTLQCMATRPGTDEYIDGELNIAAFVIPPNKQVDCDAFVRAYGRLPASDADWREAARDWKAEDDKSNENVREGARTLERCEDEGQCITVYTEPY